MGLGYCSSNGGVGDERAYCEDATIHPAFQPAKVLMADIPSDYENALKETLPDNVFTADGYLGNYTQAASYLIMVGSLATALTALFALFARRCAFSLATILSIISFLGLAIGLIIYTVIFERAIQAINDATISGVNVGITLSYGNALVSFDLFHFANLLARKAHISPFRSGSSGPLAVACS